MYGSGMTWLHALHIAICYAERGDIEYPLKLFQQSFDLKVCVLNIYPIHTYIHTYILHIYIK